MWTGRTVDRKRPVTEIVDCRQGMTGCTPFDVLEMTPLPDAP
jgi:hypothetical protein